MEEASGSPAPQAGPKGWGPEGPGILLDRDLGALGAPRGLKGKGPEPPGPWGPSGGPQGTPSPFSSRPRLGASRGPRSPGTPQRPSLCAEIL